MARMREWGVKHPGLLALLVGVVGSILVVTVDLIFGRSLAGAISNAVFYALFIGGGWYFTLKRMRKTSARLAEHDQLLMYLRYPNALPGSLSGIWDMGVATPVPGRIEFQPSVYDTLVPSGRSRTLTGLRIVSPPRQAEHKDSKQGIPWRFQIMTLESDVGVIEIAASPQILQKLQETVGSTNP